MITGDMRMWTENVCVSRGERFSICQERRKTVLPNVNEIWPSHSVVWPEWSETETMVISGGYVSRHRTVERGW